jgi:hypothetical protein
VRDRHLFSSLRKVEGASIPRTGLLMAGVLGIEVLFLLSYTSALTRPYPHGLRVAVIGPQPFKAVVRELFQHHSGALVEVPARDERSAQRLMSHGLAAGYIELEQGRLKVACAGVPSPAVCATFRTALSEMPARLPYSIREELPLPVSDPEGLVPFYLTISWVVGGYFVASLVALARGTEPRPTMGWLRLASFGAFSLVSGLAGAALAEGALVSRTSTGHGFLLTAATGALAVAAVACSSAALEAIFGQFGIGLSVLLFVVLGNPSSGGPYPPEFLPSGWRQLSSLMPNGACLRCIRAIWYFQGTGCVKPLLVMTGWMLIGAALFIAAVTFLNARPARLKVF